MAAPSKRKKAHPTVAEKKADGATQLEPNVLA
jgi:hypothetical protein